MSKLFIIKIQVVAFLLVLMFLSLHAMAAQDAIVITSESLLADRNLNTAVFEGSVIAKSDRMELSARKMTAYYGEAGAISNIVAEGSVKLVRGLQVLTSSRAIYEVSDHRFVFTGNPMAMDGTNVLIGNAIIYYLDEERIMVEGSKVFIETPDDSSGVDVLNSGEGNLMNSGGGE